MNEIKLSGNQEQIVKVLKKHPVLRGIHLFFMFQSVTNLVEEVQKLVDLGLISRRINDTNEYVYELKAD